MLHESWALKRSISVDISNERIDGLYQRAMDKGAMGGKLLGAGGGGFLMVLVKPEFQPSVIEAMSPLQVVRPGFDESGTRITYYEPSHNR